MIIKALLELHNDVEGKLAKNAIYDALKEEVALEEEYIYAANKTDNPAIKEILLTLAKAEQGHETLVKTMQ